MPTYFLPIKIDAEKVEEAHYCEKVCIELVSYDDCCQRSDVGINTDQSS